MKKIEIQAIGVRSVPDPDLISLRMFVKSFQISARATRSAGTVESHFLHPYVDRPFRVLMHAG